MPLQSRWRSLDAAALRGSIRRACSLGFTRPVGASWASVQCPAGALCPTSNRTRLCRRSRATATRVDRDRARRPWLGNRGPPPLSRVHRHRAALATALICNRRRCRLARKAGAPSGRRWLLFLNDYDSSGKLVGEAAPFAATERCHLGCVGGEKLWKRRKTRSPRSDSAFAHRGPEPLRVASVLAYQSPHLGRCRTPTSLAPACDRRADAGDQSASQLLHQISNDGGTDPNRPAGERVHAPQPKDAVARSTDVARPHRGRQSEDDQRQLAPRRLESPASDQWIVESAMPTHAAPDAANWARPPKPREGACLGEGDDAKSARHQPNEGRDKIDQDRQQPSSQRRGDQRRNGLGTA